MRKLTMNLMGNTKNQAQGDLPRVLCVCSAGLLRSPTMAYVFSQDPFNFNTRAAGISEEYGLVVVDPVLLYWADEIICAEEEHAAFIKQTKFKDYVGNSLIHVLNIPDHFRLRDPLLIDLIREKGEDIFLSERAAT